MEVSAKVLPSPVHSWTNLYCDRNGTTTIAVDGIDNNDSMVYSILLRNWPDSTSQFTNSCLGFDNEGPFFSRLSRESSFFLG